MGIGGLDPSITKDLIDSKDPKHTLVCREIAFVAIYAFLDALASLDFTLVSESVSRS